MSAIIPIQLAEQQSWLQAAIMPSLGEYPTASDVKQVVTPSSRLTAEERLEIYRRAYVARLVECLEEAYPIMRETLGLESFHDFAVGYVQAYPSRSYTLGEFGCEFPKFLAETQPSDLPAASWPMFLVELATLEATYQELFDSPGDELLAPEDWERQRQSIGSLTPELLPQVQFEWSPTLRLLACSFPVARYWSGQRQGDRGSIPTPEATYVVMFRRDYVVRHYEVSSAEFALLAALYSGATFAAAMQELPAGETLAPSDVQQWFQDWTAQRLIRGYRLFESTGSIERFRPCGWAKGS